MNNRDRAMTESSTIDDTPICNSETEKLTAILENDPPKKRIKKRYICFALIAVALLGVGVAWGATNSSQQPSEPENPAISAEQKEKTKKPDYKPTMNLHVKADGWKGDSTPVIVHIESKDGKTNAYHAFNANEDHAVEVNPGTYAMTYISPINADGSICKVSDAYESKVSENQDSTTENQKNETTFEKIPAEEVTQEQIDSILSSIKDAVAKGDKTLSGDAGKEIVDTAANNAAAAPNVDKEKVTEQAEEAKQQVQETPPASTTNNDNTSTNTNAGNNTSNGTSNNSNSSSSSSGGNSNSNSGSGSNGSASTPDPAPAPAPIPDPTPTPDPTPEPPGHQHNWVAQTETISHPAEYEQQWMSNMVYVPQYTCSYCGTHTHSSSEADAHQAQEALELGSMYSYYNSGYYEDRGSYQSVLVRDAWTEEVTTGYVCSGCGAWQ